MSTESLHSPRVTLLGSGVMPAADGATNSIALSKNCRKAEKMRILGLTSLAKTFAKRCNQEAVTQLDISMGDDSAAAATATAEPQAATSAPVQSVKAARRPKAAAKRQKRHVSRKQAKIPPAQVPDARESS